MSDGQSEDLPQESESATRRRDALRALTRVGPVVEPEAGDVAVFERSMRRPGADDRVAEQVLGRQRDRLRGAGGGP